MIIVVIILVKSTQHELDYQMSRCPALSFLYPCTTSLLYFCIHVVVCTFTVKVSWLTKDTIVKKNQMHFIHLFSQAKTYISLSAMFLFSPTVTAETFFSGKWPVYLQNTVQASSGMLLLSKAELLSFSPTPSINIPFSSILLN